jgi:dienelactone hydrolase
MRWSRCLFAAALVGLLPLSRAHAQAKKPGPPQVLHTTADFRSGGHKVRVEHFHLPGKGRRPAVILVPESNSLDKVGEVYRAIARRVAEEGYVVLMVHFFDTTGHKKGIDDPKKITEKDFRAWMAAVRGAVGYARKLPGVEPKRVGLLGFSLGGYLCLSVAADKELGIAAVASYFGGVPDKLCRGLRWLPPTFVVAGGRDTLVPVARSYAVIGLCLARGVPCAYKIYDKQGHLFREELTAWVAADRLAHWLQGKPFSLAASIARALRSSPTLREAVGAGTTFFRKHLGPPVPGRRRPQGK